MRMEGQAGAKFIQLSIQLVLIDHMLHVWLWSLGDITVNEIEKNKKKIPYPDEEKSWWKKPNQNKTNK